MYIIFNDLKKVYDKVSREVFGGHNRGQFQKYIDIVQHMYWEVTKNILVHVADINLLRLKLWNCCVIKMINLIITTKRYILEIQMIHQMGHTFKNLC